MKRYNFPKKIIDPLIIASAFILQPNMNGWLLSINLEEHTTIVLIMGTFFFMFIGDFAYNKTILKFRFIRKALARDEYIEGDWVNVVVFTDQLDTIDSIEYCRIKYKKNQFILTGDTYTKNADGAYQWSNSFQSDGAVFSNKNMLLEYFYKLQSMRVGGYANIAFTPHGSKPTRFVCNYFDETCRVPVITIGIKASDNFLDYSTEKRCEVAKEKCNEIDITIIKNLQKHLA